MRCLPYVLSDQIEIDEKYVQRSHKGVKLPDLKSRHRGNPASKRGLSNEKVCIITGVERLGKAFAKAFNMAKPSSENCIEFGKYIKDKSYVWTDGLESYKKMLNQKECPRKIVKTHQEYDSVNHLNNVNSFHSAIAAQYGKYRGVATKYINRYNALFNIQREVRDMDRQEKLVYILRRLKKHIRYFFIRHIQTEDLFTLAF